jgi:hypothetical protein
MANLSTSASMSFSRRRFVGWLVAAILLLIVLVAGVWHEREALLQGVADLWIVSDPVTHSDVAVILGGGGDTLPFIAAELHKKGLVTKVLISHVAAKRHERFLAIPGGAESTRMILQKLGVPDADIEMFGQWNLNMKDEAIAFRGWVNRYGVSSIVIPTEIFASRRARWIFNRELAGSSVHLKVQAFEPGYTSADWWKTDKGMVAFNGELMKYLYYRLKY